MGLPQKRHSPDDWGLSLFFLQAWICLPASSGLAMTISKWIYKAKLPKRHLGTDARHLLMAWSRFILLLFKASSAGSL